MNLVKHKSDITITVRMKREFQDSGVALRRGITHKMQGTFVCHLILNMSICTFFRLNLTNYKHTNS